MNWLPFLCLAGILFWSSQQHKQKRQPIHQKCKLSVKSHSLMKSTKMQLPVMMTMMMNRRNVSIRIQCFLWYSQTIVSLILEKNQNGFTTVLFGKIMSKVYVMQEFPNRTNACQKVHLKRSFGCITQATEEYSSFKQQLQWVVGSNQSWNYNCNWTSTLRVRC